MRVQVLRMTPDIIWYSVEQIVHINKYVIVLIGLVLRELIHQLVVGLMELGEIVHEIV